MNRIIVALFALANKFYVLAALLMRNFRAHELLQWLKIRVLVFVSQAWATIKVWYARVVAFVQTASGNVAPRYWLCDNQVSDEPIVGEHAVFVYDVETRTLGVAQRQGPGPSPVNGGFHPPGPPPIKLTCLVAQLGDQDVTEFVNSVTVEASGAVGTHLFSIIGIHRVAQNVQGPLTVMDDDGKERQITAETPIPW